jgi:hypothetical protein
MLQTWPLKARGEQMKNKDELWRKFKGKTVEELCAAIREIWLAKRENYIRMLDELPNKLIYEAATFYHDHPQIDWRIAFRRELREFERFLATQPYRDHLVESNGLHGLLEAEVYDKDPDAPLSEYIEADKKRDALVQKYCIEPPVKSPDTRPETA